MCMRESRFILTAALRGRFRYCSDLDPGAQRVQPLQGRGARSWQSRDQAGELLLGLPWSRSTRRNNTETE